MPSSNAQQQLFIAALGLAWIAIFAHVVIYWRLQSAGFHVKWIGYPRDMFVAYREYYRESPQKAWSRAPFYAAVGSEIGMVLVWVAFFIAGAYGWK
jgi:hypothetical protein